MQSYMNSLPTEDRLPLELSRLYEQFGYKKYCMSKFEEYGFYSDNRDFLSTDGIIAFNNSAGRLMALKPDITLSIVKNARTLSHGNAKYYYNENVYRMAEGSHDCKEIKQCGIELLGDVDAYATAEIIMLAMGSLERIDPDFSLILSHIAFVSSALEAAKLDPEKRRVILEHIKGKNRHDLKNCCARFGIPQSVQNRLLSIFDISGSLPDALGKLKELVCDPQTERAYEELTGICESLKALPCFDKLRLDLSVLNHLDYYNGVILQGYVRNAPAPVLSGGRYDSLAAKIRGEGGAFGFAVYLDGLNLYYPRRRDFDCELLILHDAEELGLPGEVDRLTRQGISVRVERKIPEGLRAKKIMKYENNTLREVAE